MYSGKYESKMKIFNAPKMVVFMNSEPEMDKLSSDRYGHRFKVSLIFI